MASYVSLIQQNIYIVPSFTLESGRELLEVPVAYKTWGKLNETKDNVMIICHAFTGSADVEDWWGPLMGISKAFDPSRFFIFCANVLGSPYGSASPVTIDPTTSRPYGPEFPRTTIRDDVNIHKIVLDSLGVTSVAVAIGGSMGGMTTLEWPLCTPPGYIRHVVPIATSARHSAWCISWGEAQRQSIYSDPAYNDGFYDPVNGQPAAGLAAARMTALLTYRSRDSFESRFGRKPQQPAAAVASLVMTPPDSPKVVLSAADEALAAHNEGHKNTRSRPQSPQAPSLSLASLSTSTPQHNQIPPQPVFSAQSYLRYQGAKFTARFDANCYIHITRKLDTHDLARGRITSAPSSGLSSIEQSFAFAQVLSKLPEKSLVIGIETDGLFTTTEQRELAEGIPDADLVIIPSPDGHDGFLLEFEQINGHLLGFLKRELPELYTGEVSVSETETLEAPEGGFGVKKESIFGEAEADITRW